MNFLILEVVCIFKIADESWNDVFDAAETKVTLPKGFAAHLAAVAVGVARGVLHAKTEQTILNRFMIPLINVAENFTEDIVLKEGL